MSIENRDRGSLNPLVDSAPAPGENQVVWVIWLTYGAFYFCRNNIAAAVPGMEAPMANGGLGLNGDQIGLILGSQKIAYGLGQFLNGQLSEQFSPRKLLAVGMLGSAALNVLFGFSTGFYFLLFVWACNGYCQSLGWTPCVRVVGNWVPVLRRGKAIGIIGTGYQITLGLTYFVAGQSAELLGWRAALYVPAVLLVGASIIMLLFLRESPDERTQFSTPNAEPADKDKTIETQQPCPVCGNRRMSADGRCSDCGEQLVVREAAKLSRGSFTHNLLLTLSNPTLWVLGISLGLLNACRYGFIDWGISHLMAVQHTGVGRAALKYVVLAVGAIAGSYLAGWATDRFFGSRRGPVISILLLTLGILTLFYESVARTSAMGTIFLLVLIGFCIFGPQVLLVGTAPADLARRGTAAAAAGFVNFMGYMGAAMGARVTGHYKMPEHGGWQVAIYIWAGWAFAAALISACLWNVTSKPQSHEETSNGTKDSS